MSILDTAHAISNARRGIEPPGERWEVVLRLAYGLPLTRKQVAIATEITGRSKGNIRALRGHWFREVWMRVGRRGRKSSTAALIAVHEILYGGHEEHLMPGETGLVAVCSKDTAGARIVLSFARSYLDALGIEFRDARMGNVYILELPAFRFSLAVLTSTTTAPRGYPIPVFIADEIAHYASDEMSANQDREILAAARPAMAQFPNAKLIAISTPLAREGVHFDTIEAALGDDDEHTVLAIEGPTWDFAPITEARCRELERDEATFQREYAAVAMDRTGSAFFNPQDIDNATELAPLPAEGPNVYAAGADFAFRSDSSALVVVRRVGDQYEVVDHEELRPGIFGPLKPSKVCRHFAKTAERYGIRRIATDCHYLEAVREGLEEHGIGIDEAPAGAAGKNEVHCAVRDLFREQRVRLPANADLLLQQLKGIVARPNRSGTDITIASPRSHGRHGDIASACILAIYSATQTGSAPIARGPYVSPDAFWYGTPGRGFG